MPTKGLTATAVEKMVPNRDKARKQLGLTRLMPSYLAKVAPAHNLPYVGGTDQGHVNGPNQGHPTKANVATLEKA